jgi:hypothetical protein
MFDFAEGFDDNKGLFGAGDAEASAIVIFAYVMAILKAGHIYWQRSQTKTTWLPLTRPRICSDVKP